MQSRLRVRLEDAICSGMDEIAGVEWRVSPGLTPYEDALAAMERRAAAIRAGEER